jgi:transcriptional regulator with PAS, ATPase and Fis domain
MNILHTADQTMMNVATIAGRVAVSRAPILISGESGTGKELLAQLIHEKSQRSKGPWVALNCAAIPEGLLESELFGYDRGAFTGANNRKAGFFELAHGGTLFLDEVAEFPLGLQAKLLRALQNGEIQRVGATQPTKVDVRIIAATHRDLSQRVKDGLFREDLFYRLNVIPLRIPALRERPRDIELLTTLFIERACHSNGLEQKKVHAEALAKLKAWAWPGNVRELQNVIERAVLLSSHPVILASDIVIDSSSLEPGVGTGLRVGMTVSEAERLLILKTLEHTEQNRTQAAQILGISIRTLRNKINEYRNDFKGEGYHEQVV